MSDYLNMAHTSMTSKTLINEYNDFNDNNNNSYFRGWEFPREDN